MKQLLYIFSIILLIHTCSCSGKTKFEELLVGEWVSEKTSEAPNISVVIEKRQGVYNVKSNDFNLPGEVLMDAQVLRVQGENHAGMIILFDFYPNKDGTMTMMGNYDIQFRRVK
ncbi:hypothetical protein [Hymenobacter sp. IS2118]|uniref:hypothetical protein n=1 Tax=Hymenobacter sp. IS2118 TaxID=1505605 RepID=UPI001268B56D|nr:hypothetical protein [Hymenobacter sp. IS2118]